ncbi:MAG: PEPxxWA-CTERM sorting domain-containing protein [Phenylobacterium sp.]
MKSAFAALAAAVLLAAAPAGATVLDQSSLGTDVGLNGIYEWQQQVTAGVDGQLSAVTLWGIGALTVRIAPGAGFYSGPYAFTQTLTFDLSETTDGKLIDTTAANIFLHAGDKFVIDFISAGDPNPTTGQGASSKPYAGGDLYLNDQWGPANYTTSLGYSLRFKTFMDPSGIPEPTTWALLLAGFAGVGATLRRRHSQQVQA